MNTIVTNSPVQLAMEGQSYTSKVFNRQSVSAVESYTPVTPDGSKVAQKGLTLVPLKLYFKQSLIKMELGLCQGKHTYDKKRSLMEKDQKREKEREIKNYR